MGRSKGKGVTAVVDERVDTADCGGHLRGKGRESLFILLLAEVVVE